MSRKLSIIGVMVLFIGIIVAALYNYYIIVVTNSLDLLLILLLRIEAKQRGYDISNILQ
jgi:hypothetical protein